MQALIHCRTRIAAAIGGVVVSLAAGHALGAGFALQENSGSGVGNAFAGGAASAEDASTLWANPAGMARLASPQIAGAVHLITPVFKFRDDGSQPAKWIYDATRPGYSNRGHTYGDRLTPSDRRALLEYLKSL